MTPPTLDGKLPEEALWKMNQPGFLRDTPQYFINTAFTSLVFHPPKKIVEWVLILLFRTEHSTCPWKDLQALNTKMPPLSISFTNDRFINKSNIDIKNNSALLFFKDWEWNKNLLKICVSMPGAEWTAPTFLIFIQFS